MNCFDVTDSAWIRYPWGKDRFLIFWRRRGSTWVTHLHGRGDSEMVVVVVDKAPISGHEAASKKHSAPCLEEPQTCSIGDEEYSISTAYKEKDCRTTLTFAAAVRREQNAASHRFFFFSIKTAPIQHRVEYIQAIQGFDGSFKVKANDERHQETMFIRTEPRFSISDKKSVESMLIVTKLIVKRQF